MKIGTFVGKETVEFTDSEYATIVEKVSTMCDEIFGMDGYSLNWSGEMSCHTCTIVPKIFSCNGECAIRLRSKHLAHFKFIRLFVYKQNGYDEKVEGYCYNWEEGYKPNLNLTSFSVSAYVIGDWKKYYGKRSEHNTGIIGDNNLCTYEYDTEISDLIGNDTISMFRSVKAEIDNAKPTNIKL